MDSNDGFYYSYSSAKQRETDRIVAKYTDDKENSYQKLIRIDDLVESFGTTTAIAYAIASVLVFGAGLSIVLVFHKYILGSVICTIGIAMLFFISKVRKAALNWRRKKAAPKILAIAKEIREQRD